MERRRFLTATVAAGTLLAGCQGGSEDGTGGSDGSDGTGGGDASDGTTTTGSLDGSDGAVDGDGAGGSDGGGGSGSGLPDHEALAGLASQPYMGPEPGTASGTIVAFEDPSCPRCAAFESEVVPKIVSDLTDPGQASYVFRGYPVIYPWGEPAIHALEAVYEADESAFWDLSAHYFDNQSDFQGEDEATVYELTETHLAETTDLDAAAVVDRARNGEVAAAVQTDFDAGKAAGAGRTTPHVFLFRDGEYQTKVTGRVDYGIIANVMGV
jgi:hypothetical protein